MSGGETLPERRSSRTDELVDAIPGLMRLGVGIWLRTAAWTAESSVRVGARLVRAAMSGESAAQLLQDTGSELRDQARRLLDLDGHEREDDEIPADAEVIESTAVEPGTFDLRARGAELLRRSADVDHDEPAHPAFTRILDQLAPDEARILRYLYLEGPQPAVDVRASKVPLLNSQLVAPGISILGQQAGCKYPERLHSYLNNLYRLGLVWFSREPLEDHLRYQVLEAQPEVQKPLREAGRGKTVRRSIHLTPFGEDFCRVCLPLDTAEINALTRR